MKAAGFKELPRPLVRYHGGKWRLASHIIAHFPPHRCYVEAFGGGASVLLRKPRAKVEVYNDLDGEIVNLFRVARDRGETLRERIALTPYARAEFNMAFEPSGNALERARRTLVRSWMGFGGNLTRENRDQTPQRTGWRTYTGDNRRGAVAHEWQTMPAALARITERLQGVIVEQRDASAVMAEHDRPDTLHYVDPPYVHSTRQFDCGGSHRGYRFELSDDGHRELAKFLHTLRGGVIVSGYACALYDRELFKGWARVEKHAVADGGRARKEVLWMRNLDVGLFKL